MLFALCLHTFTVILFVHFETIKYAYENASDYNNILFFGVFSLQTHQLWKRNKSKWFPRIDCCNFGFLFYLFFYYFYLKKKQNDSHAIHLFTSFCICFLNIFLNDVIYDTSVYKRSRFSGPKHGRISRNQWITEEKEIVWLLISISINQQIVVASFTQFRLFSRDVIEHDQTTVFFL